MMSLDERIKVLSDEREQHGALRKVFGMQAPSVDQLRRAVALVESAGPQLWIHHDDIFCFGLQDAPSAVLARARVVPIEPRLSSWADEAVRSVSRVNPLDRRKALDDAADGFSEELKEKYGVHEQHLTDVQLARHFVGYRDAKPYEYDYPLWRTEELKRPTVEREAVTDASGLRLAIQELLRRPSSIAPTTALILRHALNSPSAQTRDARTDTFVAGAVFDLGAGNVLSIFLWQFDGTAPRPTVHCRSNSMNDRPEFIIDGGNLLLRGEAGYVSLLEGSTPSQAPHRRKHHATEGDDDGDDDGSYGGNYPSTTGNPSGGGRGNSPR